ncbi:MAG: alginate export family protein [Nitrospirota bacterium]|nr:alginate export family protein [Nitrospirota bacterium]MDP2381872.1 alginate export family protein [Nitrospirota bacterium]MDP3597942.1 alginate export family protein [Nitrospirota bacterium]
MQSIHRRMGWASAATFFSAAIMAAGLSFGTAPAQAAFELPEGEKITNVPAIPRAIPQKEAYELYDPKIGKNFDIKNFWVRADLRVRPEMRNGICFGGGAGATCNALNGKATAGKQNDFYAQQMTRLGIGYDLSPDVNFYMEIIDSRNWGSNTGVAGDALSHNGDNRGVNGNGGTLGVRAAYMLVRNFAGVQGLSVKAGRQYIVFGNHSLFGHFDWANTGFSHDGVMLQYATKNFDSYAGWFRTQEGDLAQGAPTGGTAANVTTGPNANNSGGSYDADMFIFYNQIKSVPGFLIEPYYFLYSNRTPSVGAGQGLGSNKHAAQTRHNIGNRIEMRKGNFDATNEVTYQFGSMADANQPGANAGYGQQQNIHISAFATRNWIGYTHYQSSWKPRLAFNFDYATGDGRANCTVAGGAATGCKTANTFENMFPTNHIHMGYMDVQAWKNMMSPSINFQARPSKDDHIEIWATSLNLANSKDNWYRGSQGVYVFSATNNTKKHIGDELDIAWTHLFMDGKLAFQAAYGHLFAGSYIQANLGQSSNQDWAYAQLWVNF